MAEPTDGPTAGMGKHPLRVSRQAEAAGAKDAITADPAVTAAAARARAEAVEQQLRVEVGELRLEVVKQNRRMLAQGDYDTRRTRASQGNKPPKGSGDSQLDLGTLDQIRGQAQRAVRRNSQVNGLVDRLSDLIVGSGFTAEPYSNDEKFNAKAKEYFGTWAEQFCDITGKMDFAEMQRQIVRAAVTDGDIGIHLVAGPAEDIDGHDLVCLQLIESDLIANPPRSKDKQQGGGGKVPAGKQPKIINGVELSDAGRIVRFHVTSYRRDGTGISPATQAVEAENMVLVANRTRPSQTRGESLLVRMLWVQDQVHEYIRATVMSAHVAACQSMIIKTEYPLDAAAGAAGGLVPAVNSVTGELTSKRHEEIEPGSIKYLAPGEAIEQFKPEQPTQNFEQVIRTLLRIGANDLSLPLELALLDFAQTNFHAARSAVGVAYKSIDRRQKNLKTAFNRIYRFVIGNAIAAGKLPEVKGWDKVKWHVPARPSMDPQKEITAAVLAVNNNIRPLSDVHAEMGLNTDDVLEQREWEMKQIRDRNIEPDKGPMDGAVGGAGADQSSTSVDRRQAEMDPDSAD